MKWLRRSLGAFRNGLVLIVLLAMLAFNVASFAVSGLHAAMSTVALAVFGQSVVDEMGRRITKLEKRNKTLDDHNKTLDDRNKTLDDRNKTLDDRNKTLGKELDTTKTNLSSARAELDTTRSDLETSRADLKKAQGRVDSSTRRIAGRVIRGAGRNIAAVPMEVLPVVGGATVVAVTALEIKDACDSLQDMQDIRVASGIDEEQQDWTSTVCGAFSSPGVPEICDMTIDECREHAQKMREELGEDVGDEIADGIERQCDALILPDPEICRLSEQTSPVRLPER